MGACVLAWVSMWGLGFMACAALCGAAAGPRGGGAGNLLWVRVAWCWCGLAVQRCRLRERPLLRLCVW